MDLQHSWEKVSRRFSDPYVGLPSEVALRASYRCPLYVRSLPCPFAAESFLPVLRHIGSCHSFNPGFAITCEIGGCQATYRKFSSYKSHVYRKHRASITCAADSLSGSGHVNDVNCEELALGCFDYASTEETGDEPFHGDSLRNSGAKFILRMKEGLCLSQEACNEMISGVTELVGSVVTNLHRSVKRVCAAREELLGEIDGVFEDQSCVQPFTGITSQYHQRKHFIEKFGLQVCMCLATWLGFMTNFSCARSRVKEGLVKASFENTEVPHQDSFHRVISAMMLIC